MPTLYRTLNVGVTTSDVGAPHGLPDPLKQIPEGDLIGSVTADGACDTRGCRDTIADRGADVIVPPRRNAKPR